MTLAIIELVRILLIIFLIIVAGVVLSIGLLDLAHWLMKSQ